jgi:hypothetical protein
MTGTSLAIHVEGSLGDGRSPSPQAHQGGTLAIIKTSLQVHQGRTLAIAKTSLQTLLVIEKK